MTITEMMAEIKSYQEKLNLNDDYLFNIVEFTPDEVQAFHAQKAPESAYQQTLTQIQRLYLLSLSPKELLDRISVVREKLAFRKLTPSGQWGLVMINSQILKTARCQP